MKQEGFFRCHNWAFIAAFWIFTGPLCGWSQRPVRPAPMSPSANPLAGWPHNGAYHLVYSLDLTHPDNHLIRVSLDVSGYRRRALSFRLPVWYPGRYSVYNFAANLQQFHAYCLAGGHPPLPVVRTGPSRWRVRTLGCDHLRVQYRIFANTLTGSFAQFDRTHANLNGGPIYIYIPGHKPDPVRLRVRVPAGWQVLDELGRNNQTRLRFPNYDIFIDAPLEAAPRLFIARFHDHGREYRVMIHAYGPIGSNRPRLLSALKKIVHIENRVIGPPAHLRIYTFFFHFDPSSPGDGMEHLFGTQIIIPATLASHRGYSGAIADAAHEFFHQWNVKRMRPFALGPWHYSRPDPTRCLWIAEGLTQYYGEISLERAGLISAHHYLRELGANISSFVRQPGSFLMSADDSSLTAWFHDRTPLWQETNQRATTTSYYQKGDLLGVLLDLDIRRRTAGRLSLDDVFRYLWRHVYHGPRATYYLPGRGYHQRDFRHALQSVDGRAYKRFFARYVSGVRPLPLNRYFSAVGLRLACHAAAGRKNYLGLEMSGNLVTMVAPHGPAHAAGLGLDDMVVAVQGRNVSASQALPALRRLPPGRPARVQILAHGETYSLSLSPALPRADACKLISLPRPSPIALALQRQWLAGTDAAPTQ